MSFKTIFFTTSIAFKFMFIARFLEGIQQNKQIEPIKIKLVGFSKGLRLIIFKRGKNLINKSLIRFS